MRATASDCAVCQSSARKLSAACRVIRPNSSLYERKCSAMAAACSFAVAISLVATALMDSLSSGEVALRRRFGRRRRELLGFRASRHGAGGMGAGTDGGLNRIEIAGTDEGLVLGGAVAGRFLAELALLQLGISQHAVVAVSRCQLEHREIQRVPARERDEL